MNIDDLEVQSGSLGVSSSVYSLKGGSPSEKYCPSNDSGLWLVYYFERGQRSGEKCFESESQACECLLGLLEGDPTARSYSMELSK